LALSAGIKRICVKYFTFNMDGRTFTIPKGHSVLISACAWHLDQKYFPNSGKFDPERINNENIKAIMLLRRLELDLEIALAILDLL
jgi:hypothetical protein